MNSKLLLNGLFLTLSIFLSACGNSANNAADKSVTDQEKKRLNWSSIPSEFNPEIIEENFQTGPANRIYMDMFGFKDDVEVIYTDKLASGQGYLKLYTVLKESGSSGRLSTSVSGQNLELNR